MKFYLSLPHIYKLLDIFEMFQDFFFREPCSQHIIYKVILGFSSSVLSFSICLFSLLLLPPMTLPTFSSFLLLPNSLFWAWWLCHLILLRTLTVLAHHLGRMFRLFILFLAGKVSSDIIVLTAIAGGEKPRCSSITKDADPREKSASKAHLESRSTFIVNKKTSSKASK